MTSTQPSHIGPYRILGLLGEGGMGVVYLAEQSAPLRRQVALKVMKHGPDSRTVLARFQIERESLALMDHPAVATVFDAGMTEDGLPYVAMEYVPGLPITEFCNRRALPVRQRLELFIVVCEAVQHAHNKGLLHRDIKPSNVLVTDQGGTTSVKLIDFGVAKAISQPATGFTLFTEQGMLIGTPAYISPEQAGSTPLDVDTRTDIYSLGVLLYELLAGSLPLDPEVLRDAAAAEMLRMIRDEQPPKPTSRILSLGQAGATVAAQRHTDTQTLVRSLKRDLDWITMRALEKDPGRRYASASEFAADIRRHLDDEPVLAGPPTLVYRLQKLASRHRVAAASMGTVFLTLALAFTASTTLYLMAEAARERTQYEGDAWQALVRGDMEEYLDLALKSVQSHKREHGQHDRLFGLVATHVPVVVGLDRYGVRSDSGDAIWREYLALLDRQIETGNLSPIAEGWYSREDEFPAPGLAPVHSFGYHPFKRAHLELIARAIRSLRQGTNLTGVSQMKEPMSWLFALGLENVTQSDEDAEKLGRQLTQVVLEDSPGDFDQASLTLLWATFLGRRASALCRTGNPRAAVAVFREATAVFHEAISLLGTMRFASESTTKEWIDKLKIRMWELESERAACLIRDGRLVDAERILLEAHRNLPEGGQRQIARARLVELYERQQKDTQAARWKAGRLPIALNDVRNLGPVVFSSQGSGVYPIVSVPLGGRTAWAAVHVGGVPFAGMGSSSVWGWLDSKTLGSGRVVIDESVHASYLKELLQPPANGVSPPAPSTGRERRVYRLKSTVPDPERQRAFAFYDWVTLGLTYEHLTPFGDRDEEVSGALGGTSLAVWRDPEESARLQVGSGGGDRLVFGDDEPRWGDAALRAETWLYAYACDPFKGCLLGRVPFDQVLQRNAWTFYTRSGVWLSDWRKAQPVPGLNNVDHLSVQWNGYLGQYLAILSKEESSFDDDVKIRFSVAARPEGPWSAPFAELASAQVVVGTTRAVGHHPEMAQDNGRIEYLTYVPPGDVKVHVIQVTFERSDRP